MLNGVTGFVVEKNDLTTFCRKLRLLIDNKEMRITMGDEGSRFAFKKFSKQKEVARTKELYFALLRRKGCTFS